MKSVNIKNLFKVPEQYASFLSLPYVMWPMKPSLHKLNLPLKSLDLQRKERDTEDRHKQSWLKGALKLKMPITSRFEAV